MNRKRAKFVTEYLRDFNGTQAAIRAGYSPHTANEQAARLLATVSIAEAVAKAAQEARSATILTLTEAKEIASAIAKDETAARRDRLAALDRLAKFDGWDAVHRVDVTSGGQRLTTEIVFGATSAAPSASEIEGQ